MWGGTMRPSLETTPKTIIVNGNFVFITLGTSVIRGNPTMVLAVITWIGKEHELYSGASPISLVEHCVTFRYGRRLLLLLGFVHTWPTSRLFATKKEKRFSLNGNGIMSSFLGRQLYRSTLYDWYHRHPSHSIAFSALRQDQSICLSFCCLSFLPNDPPKVQNPLVNHVLPSGSD